MKSFYSRELIRKCEPTVSCIFPLSRAFLNVVSIPLRGFTIHQIWTRRPRQIEIESKRLLATNQSDSCIADLEFYTHTHTCNILGERLGSLGFFWSAYFSGRLFGFCPLLCSWFNWDWLERNGVCWISNWHLHPCRHQRNCPWHLQHHLLSMVTINLTENFHSVE